MNTKSICFALVLALAPAVAAAQQSPLTPAQRQEATRHLNQGTAAFAAGRFQDAAREAALGYTVSRNPVFLFNAANALQAAGDLEAARDRYNEFIEHPDATPAERARAQTALDVINRAIRARDTPPPPLPVAPPTPTTTPTQPAVSHPLPPVQTHPLPRTEYVRPFPYASLVLGVLGVGALGFGGWSAGVAVDTRNTRDQNPAGSRTYLQMDNRAGNATISAIVSCVAGGMLVGTAAILYALRGPGVRREVPALAFSPVPGGAFASLQLTF